MHVASPTLPAAVSPVQGYLEAAEAAVAGSFGTPGDRTSSATGIRFRAGRLLLRRFLAVGTFWKILLANALIVGGAILFAPDATHALQRDLPSLVLLATVTGATLLVNAVVLWLALVPLTELERAAQRVAAGERGARVRLSPLADRPLAELTRTFNRMVESVEQQRERGRQVASRALNDAEQTKRRLSRDLRDDSAQTLTMAMIRLRALKAVDDAVERERAIDDIRDSIAYVIEQLRSFAGELHPSALDLLGVDQVIEAYATNAAKESGVRITVERTPLRGALAPEAEIALMQIAQEAVDQAIVRARTRVRIRMERRSAEVVTTVTDDGAHLPEASAGAGFEHTLFAMRERASYFGGTVAVSRDPGGGTTARVHFPLNRAA